MKKLLLVGLFFLLFPIIFTNCSNRSDQKRVNINETKDQFLSGIWGLGFYNKSVLNALDYSLEEIEEGAKIEGCMGFYPDKGFAEIKFYLDEELIKVKVKNIFSRKGMKYLFTNGNKDFIADIFCSNDSSHKECYIFFKNSTKKARSKHDFDGILPRQRYKNMNVCMEEIETSQNYPFDN